MLSKISQYAKSFGETKYTSFTTYIIKGDQPLKKYNRTSDKVRNSIRKRFDSNQSTMKTIWRLKQNFMVKKSIKIFKEDSHCLCLLVILIDFVFKMGKNYYQQVVLEECKYIVKEKKISKFITDELEISSDESDYYDHPDEK